MYFVCEQYISKGAAYMLYSDVVQIMIVYDLYKYQTMMYNLLTDAHQILTLIFSHVAYVKFCTNVLKLDLLWIQMNR